MIVSFDEAQRILASAAKPLSSENILIGKASGRVLAEPLTARLSSPRHTVCAMDGYAVADAVVSVGARLRITGESRAGQAYAGRVGTGEAVRIFTGAPIPAGADRVIMQENIDRQDDEILIAREYGPGWHVRKAAGDFAQGSELLGAGTLLSGRAMVAAAAADRAVLCVTRRPRVALIATGDELANPGEAAERPDAIPESVSFGIAAMVEGAGGQLCLNSRGVDDLAALEKLAGVALDSSDLVVVTGGASVGDRDFAKPMFDKWGLQLLFEKVAIKPGKPVWLGKAGSKLVLGLPGNPTSAMVTGRLFLVPLLARLAGQRFPDALRWNRMPLASALAGAGNRETFVRAKWDEAGLAPLINQESGSQLALKDADWLIRCPPDSPRLDAGAMVTALLF